MATCRVVILTIALFLSGCRRDYAGCMARCRRIVGEQLDAQRQCATVCTRRCTELNETYGMPLDTCRWLQNGGREPSASPAARTAPSTQ